MFAMGKAGAFGEKVQIDYRFAVPIPDALPLEYAGPLMCAGQTVFAPFVDHNIRPGDRVGVVGIGGLGHLALRFSAAMGCITTAISRSDAKKAEAEGFGAKHFVATGDAEQVAGAKSSQDFILMTASGPGVDWAQLMGFLDTGGKIIIMGFTGFQPLPIPPVDLIMFSKQVVGSAGGSSHVVKAMLDFAAVHQVLPQIEVRPVEEINKAIDTVKDGSVRFRAVVKFPAADATGAAK